MRASLALIVAQVGKYLTVGTSLRATVIRGGTATLAALIALAVSQAPLGTPVFFALAAVPCVVYALLWRQIVDAPFDRESATKLPGLLIVALVFAVAFRIPLAAPKVGADNDMVRYMYDGRLQRLGINPFEVVPADPAVAWTHTDETRKMPSIRARTPYPAAAQLFFRGVVTIWESSRMMKWALVVCDLLTIWVLIAWLRQTSRSPWLALLYAWNPLVILEVAHSGHIDALGALWIATSAWMLSTGRTMGASIAFVLAVATKLLPIVLVPLYWKRIRIRDAAIAALVLAALYFPFRSAGLLPLGAVPNVVAFIRFNGPLFKALAAIFTPQGAAVAALLGGLAVAAWMRFRRDAGDPAAWAWPMAVSLAAAPVIYPWYLLYFTPFLFTRATLPLVVWTYSVLPVYIVWYLSKRGHRWFVPWPVVAVEFVIVLAVLIVPLVMKRGGVTRAESARGAVT
jgi:alpha-1,6-mannosyltransferase